MDAGRPLDAGLALDAGRPFDAGLPLDAGRPLGGFIGSLFGCCCGSLASAWCNGLLC